ncbi:hypothetical protein Q4485_12330 [Granulosicoccaceae sp. 1_MG-2023]|nr:hypothetical protein [Granulosicoccaceae sp. 1_MG-2023]
MIGYEGLCARFDDAEEADYDDHKLFADGVVVFSLRSRLSLIGVVREVHVLYVVPLIQSLLRDDEGIT